MISKDDIARLVEEKIAGTEFFVVEVKVSPAKIAVYIDHPKGLRLEDCTEINRFLRDKLDEALETHELEVSSPGINQPLKVLKQYKKLIDKPVAVILKNGMRYDGKLAKADEQGITVEVKQNKEKKMHEISFTEIKECKEVFSF